jgi:hypothetical protein
LVNLVPATARLGEFPKLIRANIQILIMHAAPKLISEAYDD